MNESHLKSRFLEAAKEVDREERKLEADEPNDYCGALGRFSEAQRALEAAGVDTTGLAGD